MSARSRGRSNQVLTVIKRIEKREENQSNSIQMLKREDGLYNTELQRRGDFGQEMFHQGYGMHAQGKRAGYAGGSSAHSQPTYGLSQFAEHLQAPDLYGRSKAQKEIEFNVLNEIVQQVYTAEVPEYTELVYVPDYQMQSSMWGVEQAPPLLRRPPTARQETMPEFSRRNNRERASRETEPEVIIREVEVPVEKIVEVEKEVVKIVEVLKEVEVVKDHYIFKEVPVERVSALLCFDEYAHEPAD